MRASAMACATSSHSYTSNSSPIAGAPSRNAITSTTAPGSACVRLAPARVVSAPDEDGEGEEDLDDLEDDLEGDLADGEEEEEEEAESDGEPNTAAHERMPRMRPACGPATQACKNREIDMSREI